MRKLIFALLMAILGLVYLTAFVISLTVGLHLLAFGVNLAFGLTVSVLEVLFYSFSLTIFGLVCKLSLVRLAQGRWY